MKETTITSIDMSHKKIGSLRKASAYKFRGQSDARRKLQPKAGRKPYTNVSDESLFIEWKRRSLSLID